MRWLALIFLFPSLAWAADTWVTVSTISHHFNTNGRYNERNPGLGLEHGGESLRLAAGGYTNSFNRHSTYWTVVYTPVELVGLRFGVMGGLVNGYPVNHGRYTPGGALMVTGEYRGYGFNLVGIPKIANVTEAIIALQLKMNLKGL